MGNDTEADKAVLGQVAENWREVVSPFCDVVEVYKALTGGVLTGTYRDFHVFYLYGLPPGR